MTTAPDSSALLDIVAGHSLGVLTTIKRDGRPQLSDVTYVLDREASTIRVSITDSRAKTKNIRRDPRVSLHVRPSEGWGYAVVEGTGRLSEVTTATDDDVAEALVALYRDARGEEHPDWDEYREAMVEQQRLVLTIDVERVYGAA
ncbi:PPOX class F420-dependent oxidoreductase [Pseudactinotalea suaedae]|uniref:PPOX class F420-dependent oxidoreductase n=1 Tax=Pseudactinotalea suaedae TaxID=1524924 RepID=UPI0012E25A3D|nr:PPOX class F420-dependent oxidoreductase [Pseudactinotalea suaedae]